MNPGSARTAWRVAGSIFAVAALAWGTVEAVSATAHRTRVETMRFDAATVDLVELHIADGSVTVRGTDTEEVRVSVRIDDGLLPTDDRAELQGDRGEILVLRADCPPVVSRFCAAHYTLEVPRSVAVTVSTGDGRVDVSGIDAPVTLRSADGAVVVDDLGGPLTLHSADGSLVGTNLRSQIVEADTIDGRVELRFRSAPLSVEASTVDGSVEVVVPDDGEAYRVDLSTMDGATESLVRTAPDAERSITGSSYDGRVTVRY